MQQNNGRIKVLFVCLGNICRSPLGEGVFRHLVNKAGLGEYFYIDSAGTSGYNIGDAPDPQARKVARNHGISIDDLRARKICDDDMNKWDYIIVMDSSNLKNIYKLGKVSAKLHKMRDFDPMGNGDVPDPWSMDDEAFTKAYDMIERSCISLLENIINEYNLNIREA